MKPAKTSTWLTIGWIDVVLLGVVLAFAAVCGAF